MLTKLYNKKPFLFKTRESIDVFFEEFSRIECVYFQHGMSFNKKLSKVRYIVMSQPVQDVYVSIFVAISVFFNLPCLSSVHSYDYEIHILITEWNLKMNGATQTHSNKLKFKNNFRISHKYILSSNFVISQQNMEIDISRDNLIFQSKT